MRIALLSGSSEYKSDTSLSAWQKRLEGQYKAQCFRCFGKDKGNDLPGLDALAQSDVMVVFTRRIHLPPDQLVKVKAFCASGKPIVGIRTASHAFQTWLEFDKEVLGGDYQGHYEVGPVSQISLTRAAARHPITGPIEGFTSPGSLYKNPKVAADVEVLLVGSIPRHTEPVAWTRTRANGGRVFYTSLGHPADFENTAFLKLLENGLLWAAGRLG